MAYNKPTSNKCYYLPTNTMTPTGLHDPQNENCEGTAHGRTPRLFSCCTHPLYEWHFCGASKLKVPVQNTVLPLNLSSLLWKQLPYSFSTAMFLFFSKTNIKVLKDFFSHPKEAEGILKTVTFRLYQTIQLLPNGKRFQTTDLYTFSLCLKSLIDAHKSESKACGQRPQVREECKRGSAGPHVGEELSEESDVRNLLGSKEAAILFTCRYRNDKVVAYIGKAGYAASAVELKPGRISAEQGWKFYCYTRRTIYSSPLTSVFFKAEVNM